MKGSVGRREERDYKGTQTFKGDGYMHSLDYGDSFMGIWMCQNVTEL